MVNSFFQILFDDSAAARAHLTSALGVDSYHLNSSLPGFESKDLQELMPPGIQDRFVQSGLLSHIRSRFLNGAFCRSAHVGDSKVFMADSVVVPDQIVCQLEMEVPALIPNLLVGLRHQELRLQSILRPILLGLGGKLPLARGKYFSFMTKMSRVGNHAPIREGGEFFKAKVDPNLTLHGTDRNRHVVKLAGKACIPVPAGVSADRQGLDLALSRSRQLDLDLTNVCQAKFSIQELVAGLGEGHRPETLTALESWKSAARKEALVRFVQSIKHFLKRLCIDQLELSKLSLQVGELLTLFDVTRRFSTMKGGNSMFQCYVVHQPAKPKLLIQDGLLPLGWINTVSKGCSHISIIPEMTPHAAQFISQTLKSAGLYGGFR